MQFLWYIHESYMYAMKKIWGLKIDVLTSFKGVELWFYGYLFRYIFKDSCFYF